MSKLSESVSPNDHSDWIRSRQIHVLILALAYINCLFVCLLNSFLTFSFLFFLLSFCLLSYLFTSLLVYFLTYLSTPSRIDPFHCQAGGHRR